MRIYLDEHMASGILVALLGKAGHALIRCQDARMTGKSDAENFLYAIQQNHVLLTQDHEDFEHLHGLVVGSGGHHSGVMTVRSEKNPARRMKSRDIVFAIRKLESAGVPIADELHILNQWR